MKVKIVSGAYGFRTEKGYIEPVRKGETVCLDDAEAKRLVDLGAAVFVDEPLESALPPPAPDEGEEPDTEPDFESMTKAELGTLAEDMGVDISSAKTKKEILALLSERPPLSVDSGIVL